MEHAPIIREAAWRLVAEHGPNALGVALGRLEVMTETENENGTAMWVAILEAVWERLSDRAEGDSMAVTVHAN